MKKITLTKNKRRKGRKKQFTIRHDQDVLDATDKAAVSLGKSMNVFIWDCVIPKLKKLNLLTKD